MLRNRTRSDTIYVVTVLVALLTRIWTTCAALENSSYSRCAVMISTSVRAMILAIPLVISFSHSLFLKVQE